MTEEMQNKTRQRMVGRVVSTARAKTVAILVERRVAHPLYGKIVTKSRKFHAHCEDPEVALNDVVEIEECRPISKTKTWKVVRLVSKARLA
ncbi:MULTISPECIES: 30S ribosomal protein S17 [Tepidiphilus]|uniref:Small ribosomal subunit protein uS17 n=1 Tax=Tepidiphilus baoligensis TaxID=2698687 RepID=A0ABX1QJB1_9PROT|nr:MULTISPECIES: 30S ribosomal protein S17 [Tepidiphilus]NMH15544.1 30S ribosomal protein S17 [Tepidiphilus baoligensis]